MSLTKRLQNVLNLIQDSNAVLADIGTDHAYLPIAAIQQQKVRKAYAVDVNSKPLKFAKENIIKANLSSSVIPILSNGLEFINEIDDEIIDIVSISGLGTSTILEILKQDNKKIKEYIICSNTEIKNIRLWALLNNYQIKYEHFFIDYNREYWLINIIKNNQELILKNELDIEFGDFNWFINNKEYQKYLIKKKSKIQELLTNIKVKNKTMEFYEYINKIDRYLKQWN